MQHWSSAKADKCALVPPKVAATLVHRVLQPQHLLTDVGTEVGQLQGTPHLIIRVMVEWIQVHSECSAEENCILKYYLYIMHQIT